jgi:hypothetical protein
MYKVKNFLLYFDQYDSLAGNMWEDIVVNPIESLPKVLSPRKVPAGIHVDEGTTNTDNEGSSDVDFIDSDYELDDKDDDLFYDNDDDGVVDEGAGKGMVLSKGKNRNSQLGKGKEGADREWDELTSNEDELELPDSDEEGHPDKNLKTFRPEDMHNPIFKIGMKFALVEMLRSAITEYRIKQRVEIKMPKNDQSRIKAHCDTGCPWNLYASYDSRLKCFLIKSYVGDHRC